ncbi:hypothetical protein K438DRAFT_201409 [Mycena galopus ATCC 62051]|nr:hypothetical protein K438DRAFT_201409 [Mycena galopus ATCC 62051]
MDPAGTRTSMARRSSYPCSSSPHALRPDLKTSTPVDGGRAKTLPPSSVPIDPLTSSPCPVSPLSYRPASVPLGRMGAPASSLSTSPQAAGASEAGEDLRDRGAEPSARRCVEGRKIRQSRAYALRRTPPDPLRIACIWGAHRIGGATPTPTPIQIQIPSLSSTAAGTGSRGVQLRAPPTPRSPALSRIRRTKVYMGGETRLYISTSPCVVYVLFAPPERAHHGLGG